MPQAGERRATVRGRGVAGLTCARLLRRAGWDVALDGPPARPVPVLLLGAPTVELLESIWGKPAAGGHALEGRRVHWGPRPDADTRERGLVVDGRALLHELERRTPSAAADRPDAGGWVIEAGGRAPGARRLGRRTVLQARVALMPAADERRSRMETSADGWLFLIPTGGGGAIVQAMVPGPTSDPGATLERMLAAAPEIAVQVSRPEDGEVVVLDAAPAARDPIAVPGRIAVGDAARAFDPLAGDGTGQAVRGAVLAAAVLESRARGLAEAAVLDHYDHRVRLAFLRHLAHLVRFYGEAFGGSAAWRAELEPMWRELGARENRALAARPFRYRLAADALALHHDR